MSANLLFALALIAGTPTATAEDDFAPILVQGRKDAFTLNPKRLRAAVATINKEQPKLAPAAPLAFQVVARGASLDGVLLRMDNGKDEKLDLQPDAKGIFTLPAVDVARQDWWITGNRKARTMYIRPLIRTPGTSEVERRVGDDRLLCKVGWSLLKDTVEPFARMVIDVGGGPCAFLKFGIYTSVGRPIERAVIRDGTREIPVPLGKDGKSYRLLEHDKSISNDARLFVTYKTNS